MGFSAIDVDEFGRIYGIDSISDDLVSADINFICKIYK